MRSTAIVAALYVLTSLGVILLFRLAAEKISGSEKLKHWVWPHVALSVLWCASQLSVSDNGSFLFSLSPVVALENNDLVKWVAFISIFFQAASFPRHEKMKSWFFWRNR